MDRYVQQLIEDFQESIEQSQQTMLRLGGSSEVKNEAIQIRDFDDGLLGEKSLPFSQMVGIEHYYLPSAERLTEDQIEALFLVMVKLQKTWNIEFVFPHDVPVKLRYEMVRDAWCSEVPYGVSPIVQFRMCQKNCSRCQFVPFCNWTKTKRKMSE